MAAGTVAEGRLRARAVEPALRERMIRVADYKVPSRPGGFVIHAPCYAANSAGNSCLYRLCDALRGRGFPAFMTGGLFTAPHLDAPIVPIEDASELCRSGFTAIYPETVAGNPLRAPRVIRWVLNRPGLLGGDAVYAADESVYSYAECYLPYIENDVAGKLCMPTIDETVFFTNDSEPHDRSLECFYIGKSRWREGVCDRSTTFEITRESPDKSELGKLFRASRVLYCFDNTTVLTYEALLCGCPVVIVPDGTQTRSDYEQLALGMAGISWGPGDRRALPLDVPALRARYAALKQAFDEQLTALIADSGHAPVPGHENSACMRADFFLADRPFSLAAACRRRVNELKQGRKRLSRHLRAWQRRRKAVARCERWLAEMESRCGGGSSTVPWRPDRRSLVCFYLGNGTWREGFCDRGTAFNINAEKLNSDPNARWESLLILLRAARLLVCFDPGSPMTRIALREGCPVTVVSAEGKSVTYDPGTREPGTQERRSA